MSAGGQILFLALFMMIGCQMRYVCNPEEGLQLYEQIYNQNLEATIPIWETVTADEEAICECGIFKFATAEKTNENPIISKSPQFNFECNADGIESCSNMCKALAGASRPDGPRRICETIENSEKTFVPAVYYKACNADTWTYTGMKPTLKVCCKNKEVIPCNSDLI